MPYATCQHTDPQQRFTLASPRYGCYPAPELFEPAPSSFEYLKHLRATRPNLAALSLYVHLPFCTSACYHCERASVIGAEPHVIASYLEALKQEIRLVSAHIDKRQLVERLHVGGGTPTLLSHEQLRSLMSTLHEHMMLLESAGDYSIELDPRVADWAMVGTLRELGFNRVQIRVQALTEAVQNAINRHPTLRQVRALVEAARTLQFASVGVDLVIGLPEQTLEGMNYTLERMLALQPDRLVLKTYQHKPWQRHINANRLPQIDYTLGMLKHCEQALRAGGYIELGMGHFVLADDDLALAQDEQALRFDLNGYSSHNAQHLIGLGLGAISQVGGLYTRNSTSVEHYQHLLLQKQLPITLQRLTSLDEQMRAYVIEQLHCHAQIDFARFNHRFNLGFTEHFNALEQDLQALANQNLIGYSAQHLTLNQRSREVLLRLCRLFDAHANTLET